MAKAAGALHCPKVLALVKFHFVLWIWEVPKLSLDVGFVVECEL